MYHMSMHRAACTHTWLRAGRLVTHLLTLRRLARSKPLSFPPFSAPENIRTLRAQIKQ